jgi:uncharacterized protein (DUF433 family)
MVTKTDYRYIVQSPDTAGGKPRIAGRRITVQNVVIWHEQMGFSVDEIASQYDLQLAEIYAALAYYFDHKAAVDQSIAADEAYVEMMRKQTPSLLARKLHERND